MHCVFTGYCCYLRRSCWIWMDNFCASSAVNVVAYQVSIVHLPSKTWRSAVDNATDILSSQAIIHIQLGSRVRYYTIPPVSAAGRVPVVKMNGPTSPYWSFVSQLVTIPHLNALVVFIIHMVCPLYKLVAQCPIAPCACGCRVPSRVLYAVDYYWIPFRLVLRGCPVVACLSLPPASPPATPPTHQGVCPQNVTSGWPCSVWIIVSGDIVRSSDAKMICC